VVWVRRFEGNIHDDVLMPLAKAMPTLTEESTSASRSVRIIGPLPLYYSRTERLITRRRLDHAARQVGWRALVFRDLKPLAIVDCGIGPTGHAFQAVSGEHMARELSQALARMGRLVGRRGWSHPSHEIRVLEVPQLALSVVWKAGPPTLIVPVTRTGDRLRQRHATVLSGWRMYVRKHKASRHAFASRRHAES
jgi:hypothetical protein